MDYRLKENRREAFIRWYAWSLEFGDCDPAVWATNYLNSRYEHNSEQRLWLCWLYGNTYYLPTSWVLMNEFPDFELATVDRMTSWNTENYKRLRYQTDTKWSKGYLPEMFASYQQFIGNKSQRTRIESYYGDNEKQSFDNLWTAVNDNYYKFGRYTSWFYLQHLKHTAGVKIEPTSLMLNDYSGSRSHRNGLLMALGQDDLYDAKLTKVEYSNLEAVGLDILTEMRSRFPHLIDQLDFFTMETSLCAFKKIFRERNGRYLGYYLDRQAEEIKRCELDGWFGIEWEVMWQARTETRNIDLVTKQGVNKGRFGDFLATGKLRGLDMLFPDEVEQKSGLDCLFGD